MSEEEKEEILKLEKWIRSMGLLKEANLIRKQQKEIEEYSKIFKNTKETTLYADGQPIQKIIELTNYISKDKIKEILKNLEEQKKKEYEEIGISTLGGAIDILKKILGE